VTTANDYADVFLALARNAPPEDDELTVYDGPAPINAEPPYAVLYLTASALRDSTSLANRSDRHLVRATYHCCGEDTVTARAVAQRICDAVLDLVPTIAGRVCFPIRQEVGTPPPRPDESTGRPVISKIDVYELETVPETPTPAGP